MEARPTACGMTFGLSGTVTVTVIIPTPDGGMKRKPTVL